MSIHGNGAGGDAGPTPNNVIKLGPTEYTIETVSARKASAAWAIMRRVGKAVRAVADELAEFDQNYGATHYLELTPVQARLRYPRRVLLGEDGFPIYEPEVIKGDAGEEDRPNPRAGDLIYLDSPVDSMTEEDWARSNGVLRLPAEPEPYERIAAVFDKATEQAEEELYKLLALFTFTNAEVKAMRRDGTIETKVAERADDIVDDAQAEELLMLAVLAGEVVDDQFRRKAAELGGGRLGKALGLLGVNLAQEAPQTSPEPEQTTGQEPSQDPDGSSPSPTPETSPATPESSTPTLSTDSPAPTADGPPTPSSTPPTTSSSPSGPASTETEPTPSLTS